MPPGGLIVSDLREHLIYFLNRERSPLARDRVCDELERFGSVSADVPAASIWDWSETINDLIADGLATETAKGVAIVRKAEPVAQDVSQGELF